MIMISQSSLLWNLFSTAGEIEECGGEGLLVIEHLLQEPYDDWEVVALVVGRKEN